MTYRFESEFSPIQNMRLKIEINTREHFTELGLVKIPFNVNSRWFKGSCEISTYQLEELIGTKLRALYQRSKGRDLYDQYQALKKIPELNTTKVIQCYHAYMKLSENPIPSKEMYIKNIEEKMANPEFTGDTIGLIRPEENWNSDDAYKLIKKEILVKI